MELGTLGDRKTALFAIISNTDNIFNFVVSILYMRRCSVCGVPFASSSNRAIYCPDCQKRITRRQTAERMRKMRRNVT